MYDYLVVGAGLFGAVFAHEAKKNGKSVLVIDKRPNIIPFAPYLELIFINMEHTYFIRMILECGII